MSTLDDLLLQQADILEKIKIEKANGKAVALSSVLKLIEDYDLTLEDLKIEPAVFKSHKKREAGAAKTETPGGKKRGRPRKVQLGNEMNLE